MTEQLALSVPKPTAASSTHSGRRIRIVPPATDHGRLDEHTREVGRQGVAAAREALAAANRRANARIAERQAEREAELSRRAGTRPRRRAA